MAPTGKLPGIPQPFLQKAKVYVIDANSRYPYEWFDAEKSVDLKAAKQIGLTIPPSVLARADQVIK